MINNGDNNIYSKSDYLSILLNIFIFRGRGVKQPSVKCLKLLSLKSEFRQRSHRK